jgi:tetratricopeptide (TPR) repeat protein
MFLRIISLLIASSTITACSFLPTNQASNNLGATEDSTSSILSNDSSIAPSSESVTTDRPFPASTIYSLLVAEVAGQRQQFDISLVNYLDQAERTQDPGVAERATHIAQYVGANKYTLRAAQIWANNAPSDPQAHQALAQAFMIEGDYSNALKHMEAVFELVGDSQFDYLALNAQELSANEKIALLQQFETLVKKHPDYSQLWMAKGTLLLQLENYADALPDFEQALSLRPYYTAASISKARALHKLERTEEALAWLDDLHDQQPKHKGIGVLRARILIDLTRYSEARAAFQYLNQQFPDDQSIKLSLGLLNIELQEYDEAIATLTPLTLSRPIANEAYFYLARIAEIQEDYPRALLSLNQVQQGRQFLPAQLQTLRILMQQEDINAARDYLSRTRSQHPNFNTELVQLEIELLIQEDDIQEAYNVANLALNEEPDNIDFLYSRGLLAEKLDNIQQLETDLRKIIQLNPNNAEAMNALGYTLADKTNRLDEAQALVEQANKISPNTPAIIDSLGWIHYRLGNLDKALALLQSAYSDFPDHEVAAHLGEVLWQLDRNDEANDIWQQGLKANPESSVIKETQQRLNTDAP